MKALWTALVLLASSAPLLADVSREEVRRLLDAHVSEQTIISYVQRNGPMEAMSVEDLSDLKSAGASDSLLQALIQAQTGYSSNRTPSTDTTTPYSSGSSTVIYDSPQYYYYPSTAYPTYSYSYPAPYYSTYYPYYPYRYYYPSYRYYPNRYYAPTYYGHNYPYRGHSGYYGTHHPTTVTPRYPAGSGGVNVYRQSPQPRTVTPRTVAPQPSAPRPQAPATAPRGGGVPRR